MTSRSKALVICVKNEGYAVSLERRRLYVVLADPLAEKLRQLRVIDESGEDHLYPEAFFLPIDRPQTIRRRVLQAA